MIIKIWADAVLPTETLTLESPSWRWLVSSQAEGVLGPPVVCGPVGLVLSLT
jgi:hypothetical protein